MVNARKAKKPKKEANPPTRRKVTKEEGRAFIKAIRQDHLLSFSAEYDLDTDGWVCKYCEHVNCSDCDTCATCGRCRGC